MGALRRIKLAAPESERVASAEEVVRQVGLKKPAGQIQGVFNDRPWDQTRVQAEDAGVLGPHKIAVNALAVLVGRALDDAARCDLHRVAGIGRTLQHELGQVRVLRQRVRHLCEWQRFGQDEIALDVEHVVHVVLKRRCPRRLDRTGQTAASLVVDLAVELRKVGAQDRVVYRDRPRLR